MGFVCDSARDRRLVGITLCLIAALGAATSARGQLLTPDNRLPPPSGVYIDTEVAAVDFGGTNSLLPGAQFHGFGTGVTPNGFGGADQTVTTTTRMTGVLRQGTVDSFFDVFADVSILVRANQTPNPSDPQNYPMEMLSLSLTGGGLPTGVQIRESLTLVSIGGATVMPTGGLYHIDSFFDVFVELSLDGSSWNPGSRPLKMHLTSTPTPEPVTLALSGAFLAAAVGRRLRSRK